jgi:hypothetical protein
MARSKKHAKRRATKPVSAKRRATKPDTTSKPDDAAQELAEFLATSSNENDEQVLRLCVDFLKRNPHIHDRDTLALFLGVDADPPRENTTSILPLDELEERLMYIERLERELEIIAQPMGLNRYQFAGLLLMPIGNLRRLSDAAFALLRTAVQEVERLVRICKYIQPF